LPSFSKGISEEKQQEGVSEHRELLNLDMEDDELIKAIDKRINEQKVKKAEIDAVNISNERFFLGDQVDFSKLFDHQARVINNKIYQSIETIVPILATKSREPLAISTQNTDESRRLANITQEFLSWKFNEQDMHLKLAELIRFFNIFRIAAFKYRYVGDGYDDFVIELKRPECLIIDDKANPEDMEFMGEYLKDTAQGIIDRFATKDGKVNEKKKKKILSEIGISDKSLGTEVTYIEIWTPDFVVWKLKNIILDKEKNPNWLWDTKGKKAFNHFLKPKMPYILFSWMTMGEGTYGKTTSLEQAVPIQKNINKRKRQITDNADEATGTWIFNEQFVSKEEAAKFKGAPKEHLMYKGDGNVNEAVGRMFPKELGPQVFADLQDDKAEIDNTFGTHSTTRGERTGQKTAKETTLLKESDFGRLDLMSQYIDIKVGEVYNAFIQMSLVFNDESKTLRMLGPDREQQYLDYSRDNIEEGIEIIVKTEPLLAQAQMVAKYMELYKSGAVDPLTMYERLNLPNPKELTQRMVMFKADPMMYLGKFAVDENTEGMEDDPVNTARRDIEALEKGEEVPPAPEVTREHVKEHVKHAESAKFKKLKKEIQSNIIQHMRAEDAILTQQTAQARPQRPPQAVPAGGVPQNAAPVPPQGSPQGLIQ